MESQLDWMKISELEKRSGVHRRTIQFYVQKQLLHEPKRTGKTMAYYDGRHLSKLRFIQEEKQKGLPLIAIKKKIWEVEVADENRMKPISYRDFSGVVQASVKKKRNDRTDANKTRNSIIELGCRMFLEKGLKGTKVSDITTALSIGKGSFYFYFRDKRELFLTCIPLIFEKMFSTGYEKVREAKDPLERIEMRGKIILPVLKEFCAIVHLSKEAIEDDDQKIKTLGTDIYQSIRMPVEADIRKGIRQGMFQNVDPRVASTLLLGMIENIYYLKSIEKEMALQNLWENLKRFLKNGICLEKLKGR